MTVHEAKEWLNQAYRMQEQISCIKKEMNMLQEMAEYITPIYENREDGKSSNISDRTATIAIEIADKQREYEQELQEYIEAIDRVKTIISQVCCEDERLLLRKRYLDFERWEQIALELNYSLSYIFEIHRSAIKKVCKIIEK